MDLLKKFIRKIRTPFLLTSIFLFLLTSAGSAQTIARAGLLEAMQIRPGVAVEIPIDIEDVVDLYGIEIELEFDPTFWEFEDADNRREGIQPAIGTFLDPGMTLFNIIDMEEGRIHLVMSQLNPSEGKSGDGTIMVLYATAIKTGVTSFEVKKVELATREGMGIEVEGVDGQITIESQAPIVTATPIPVIEPTMIIIVPTYSPPTATPIPTATPKATQTRTATATTQATLGSTATNVPTAALGSTATVAPTATLRSTATLAPGATLASTATLVPTATQGQVITQSTQPTTAAEIEGEETATAEPTAVSEVVNTLQAPTETASSEGRVLAKDQSQSLGRLLPWLIGAIVLLIIAAGIYLIIRKNRVISEEHK